MAADATAADIKSAYRQAALKTHPDVSDAPDATQQFSQLSSAYGERLAQVLLHLPCTGVAAPASHVNTYMPLHDCLLKLGGPVWQLQVWHCKSAISALAKHSWSVLSQEQLLKCHEASHTVGLYAPDRPCAFWIQALLAC